MGRGCWVEGAGPGWLVRTGNAPGAGAAMLLLPCTAVLALQRRCSHGAAHPYQTAPTQNPSCLPCRREQIVQFILQNTAGDAGPSGSGAFVDPYTGAGAYVPPPPGGSGAAPAASGFGGGSADPFTGAGAYVPPPSSSGGGGGGGGHGVTGGGADPFTGGGAAPPRHLPAKNYLVYEQVGLIMRRGTVQGKGVGGQDDLRWPATPAGAGRHALLVPSAGRSQQATAPPACPVHNNRRCRLGMPSAKRLASSRRRWRQVAAMPLLLR